MALNSYSKSMTGFCTEVRPCKLRHKKRQSASAGPWMVCCVCRDPVKCQGCLPLPPLNLLLSSIAIMLSFFSGHGCFALGDHSTTCIHFEFNLHFRDTSTQLYIDAYIQAPQFPELSTNMADGRSWQKALALYFSSWNPFSCFLH